MNWDYITIQWVTLVNLAKWLSIGIYLILLVHGICKFGLALYKYYIVGNKYTSEFFNLVIFTQFTKSLPKSISDSDNNISN